MCGENCKREEKRGWVFRCSAKSVRSKSATKIAQNFSLSAIDEFGTCCLFLFSAFWPSTRCELG
jgi:hypothetical protein